VVEEHRVEEEERYDQEDSNGHAVGQNVFGEVYFFHESVKEM